MTEEGISRIEKMMHGRTPEEQYECLDWLMHKYGLGYNQTRGAIINWLAGNDDSLNFPRYATLKPDGPLDWSSCHCPKCDNDLGVGVKDFRGTIMAWSTDQLPWQCPVCGQMIKYGRPNY